MNLLEINVVLALVALLASSIVSFWQGEWSASMAAVPLDRMAAIARRGQTLGPCRYRSQNRAMRDIATLAHFHHFDFDGSEHWFIRYSDYIRPIIGRRTEGRPKPTPFEVMVLEQRGAYDIGFALGYRALGGKKVPSHRAQFLLMQQGGC